MGMGCGCTRRIEGGNNSNPVLTHYQLSSIRRLRDYYSHTSVHPKLQPYFLLIFSGLHAETTKFTIKLTKFQLQDAHSLKTIMEFYAEIREFQLWKVGLNEEMMEIFSVALKSLSKITVLSLEDNNISDNSLFFLSKQIDKWTNLREIWLPANKITGKGVSLLLDALQDCREIEVICLDYNELRTLGVCVVCKALLSRAPLRRLSLQYNEVQHSLQSGLETLGRLNPPTELTSLQGNLFTPTECSQLRTEFGSSKVCVTAQRQPLVD